jgi:Ca2+-binding RTX toxin-like protein
MAAGVRERLCTKVEVEHVERLPEPLESHARRVERPAKAFVVATEPSRTQTELEPSSREHLERRAFESGREDGRPDRDLFVGRGRSDSFGGDPGNDTFRGGDGEDSVWYFRSPAGVTVDLVAGTATGNGRDALASIEDVVGSRHDDSIRGTPAENEIFTSAGDDTVYGLGGDDEITDDGGSDELYGGPGRDLVATGWCVSSSDGDTECQPDEPAPDTLKGGPGNDTVGSGPGNDRVEGGPGNDRLDDGDGADAVFGGDGDDKLYGGAAAGPGEGDDGKTDELDGGPGTDECSGEGDERVDCE